MSENLVRSDVIEERLPDSPEATDLLLSADEQTDQASIQASTANSNVEAEVDVSPLETEGDSPSVVDQKTPTPTINVVDPGITLVKRSGQPKRRRTNKATQVRKRSQFQAERKQAAKNEAAGISEDSLRDRYASFIDRNGRRPTMDDLLNGLNSAKASKKATRVIGDPEKFGKQVEEDKAWDEYYAAPSTPTTGEKAELAALPAPENELDTLYGKRPADWTRADMIAIYSAFSKHSGHWLAGSELQALCKSGIITTRYKVFMNTFGSVTELNEEARQNATWYQAKRERDGDPPVPEPETPQVGEIKVLEPEVVVNVHEEVTITDPRGELYNRIVDAKRLPKVKPSSVGRNVRFTILDDRTLEIDGKKIELARHKLFALNALLMTRNEASTPKTLAEIGFDPKAKISDLLAAIKSLSSDIKRAAQGDELISRWSNGSMSLYILSPNVVVSDGRQLKQKIISSNRSNDKMADEHSEQIEEFAEFDNDQERDIAIASVVKRYRYHSLVLSAVESIKNEPESLRLGNTELQQYFGLIKQFSVLNYGETQELFQFVEKGLLTYQEVQGAESLTLGEEASLINLTVAQQVLFLSNLRLVVSIARPFAAHNMLPLADLIQEGNVGLGKAISRFDYSTGYQFSTYATWWIRQSVQRALANQGRTIRVPVHAHETWLKLNKDTRALENILERSPTEEEIAKFTGLDAKKVRLYRNMGGRTPLSLDQILTASIGDAEGPTLADVIPNSSADMGEFTDQLSALIEVRNLFASRGLTDREKLILGLRYGTYESIPRDLEVRRSKTNRKINYLGRIARINSTDGLTLESVGGILGITRERVRQLEKVALQKSRIVIDSERRK